MSSLTGARIYQEGHKTLMIVVTYPWETYYTYERTMMYITGAGIGLSIILLAWTTYELCKHLPFA